MWAILMIEGIPQKQLLGFVKAIQSIDLSANILTVCAHRLLGPNDTLLCILIKAVAK